MLRFLMGAAALASLSSPVPASAQVHQPSTRWQVDFGAEGCVALRDFAGADRTYHLVVKPNLIGQRYEIALIENGWRGETQSREGTLRFDGAEQEVPALRYADKENGRVVTSWFADDLTDLADTERLDLQFAGQRMALALTQTAMVVEALESCRVQLADYYNMDESKLAEGPKGDSMVFHARNYPKFLGLDGEEGIIRAMLLLDDEGSVVDCSLLSFAGDAIFMAHSCGMLHELARFEPAIGLDGKPTRSVHVTPAIHWRIVGNKSDALTEEFLARDAALWGGAREEEPLVLESRKDSDRREGSRNNAVRGGDDNGGQLLRPPGK
ncbi:hypothetical protein [Sphingomicrobium aestuariivivum]|uniref:hypothetical protein n=1 Tax=Sphingomicrobium aestuariivivum TaxID=1582356 RepID=UPI001FD6FE32|nr:hypothetical protein [Sphingomicrobium aestuariivivum]MCJ8191860.1 hypothetical protein [Sphingomicrobium aestuariivivum]